MRKFLITAIPIVTLVFFILIMLSGSLLKKPIGKKDNIPETIEAIISAVNNDNWEEVAARTDDLEQAWEKVVNRIQFSSERDEINSFTLNIARLRGAIFAKDKTSALIELSEAIMHWKELGK